MEIENITPDRPSLEPLMSVEQAGRFLQLSPWTVRKWFYAGRIHAVRLGKRVLFEPAELRRLIGANRVTEHISRPRARNSARY
jgi:excisionase family DNA binding protein